ncbi:DUF2273 domain-containing protein [Kineococcus gynurae]|uniref:DUF2273 domain-containing protein n=1 Tax=Kineococcus gynurae TaxID=452979 RepID=A0ABV5LU57_9ACTN
MSTSLAGLFVGLLLTVIAAIGGFGWLVLGLLLGAVGYAVGAHLEGRIDLRNLVPGNSRG